MPMNYTASQLDAIKTVNNNLQIIACAGSGKTQVISARIVEILRCKREQAVGPGNIVAFTFTDKAAGELKDRIHRLCKEELGLDTGLAEMFVGTIHAYCLDLLQSPPLYRYLKYRVLSDVQQRLLIDRYSQQSGLTTVRLLNGQSLERWKDSKLYQQLLAICEESGVDTSLLPPQVAAARQDYVNLLHAKRYLDYTMIISEALKEIRINKGLRTLLASKVKFLVVDEYQDVNPLQEQLVAELYSLGANLCVVGDDDQTIYQWRGSDVRNIIEFSKRYAPVKQLALNENFRSSKAIVSAARQVAERNAERLNKKMESTAAQPYARGDLLALSFNTPEAEAAWIVTRVQALHGTEYRDRKTDTPRGLIYSDFAVLLRSVRHDALAILAALDQAGIRYVVGGMNRLFETAEIATIRKAFFFLGDFSPDGHVLTSTEMSRAVEDAQLGVSSARIAAAMALLNDRKAKLGVRMDAELYLQRLFLDFLNELGLREGAIDAVRGSGAGEIVYYNFGKFSQVISDYEQIHFNSAPSDLYPAFAKFLHFQAPDYYPEGWEDAGYARPDAVQVMTVHQAKGMQWPVVFVPCLRRNRFPSRAQGGRQVWHVIPDTIVPNASRYKGSVEDERRLFYVALTRAERYLHCSWAPIADNQQQRNVSQFFNEFTASEFVLTKPSATALPPQTTRRPRHEDVAMTFTFSELKYYFSCPYLFKLRFLYGFDAPINRALGYGKSLHDALAEIHSESIKGNAPSLDDVPRLVDEHLHLPFANREVDEHLRKAAREALSRYLREHGADLTKLEHVEKPIELKLQDGIVVNGRVDLIRRTDTNEIVIVDFKSDERAQAEDISAKQLHVYAVGYQQLTGKNADLIEIHNLDRGGAKREEIDQNVISSTLKTISDAGQKLRENDLPRLNVWSTTCASCDMVGICRDGAVSTAR
jgi:DNA helicase II / ATP-dependent DNA helicase PcrA